MAETAELKPCPFCGGGTTEIKANGGTWNGGMKPRQPPVSWDVQHWCPRIEGQPGPRLISRCGKTEADAISAWNTRADLSRPAPDDDGAVAEMLDALKAVVGANNSAAGPYARLDMAIFEKVEAAMRRAVDKLEQRA